MKLCPFFWSPIWARACLASLGPEDSWGWVGGGGALPNGALRKTIAFLAPASLSENPFSA